MDLQTLDRMKSDFQSVAEIIGSGLATFSPRVIALAAKWQRDDLVPGLSDLDFRLICADETSVEEWIEIDREIGRIHLKMVTEHPEWNRINEHTVGAAMRVSEVLDPRYHNPEYTVWTCWWGDERWLTELQARMRQRPFDVADERYHLGKFLSYYSPYQHGIDPGINLGMHARKYPLHSRCWHYFAPPMLSAASLLARANLPGKRDALQWLLDHGYIVEPVQAILHQVNSHYETAELEDSERLRGFEKLLFGGFQRMLPALVGAVEGVPLPESLDVESLKKALSAAPIDGTAMLVENVRFARTRIGRCHFYLSAPPHFDAQRQFTDELVWARKLTREVFASLRALVGNLDLSEIECFEALDVTVNRAEMDAVRFMIKSADIAAEYGPARSFFENAIDIFPDYYRVLDRTVETISRRMR